MPTDVIMPALGMAQDTGIVVQWLKQPGDAISKGEPLFEVETDKAVVEVESPASGVLGSVTAAEGSSVPVGQAIAVILAEGEKLEAEPSVPPRSAAHTAGPGPAGPRNPASAAEASAPPATAQPNRLRPASPAARRRAQESGLDIDSLQGSGPGGAVISADIATAPAAPSAPATFTEPSRTWRVMAERTTAAWSAPHFYLTREAVAERLISWRSALADRGAKVTYTDLLVKLAAVTLRNHPHLNSRWDGGSLQPQADVSIGVAVATDDGLTVPVIRKADMLPIPQIAAERERLLDRARNHHLSPADLEGGTFTITNLGMLGVDEFTAIINAGQAAILAVGRIVERPIARGGQVVAAPTIVLTLGCDHRAVDGARGARFLQELAAAIEEPAILLD